MLPADRRNFLLRGSASCGVYCGSMIQKQNSAFSFIERDRSVFITLVLVGLLVRLPFLRAFYLVSYDGTYYINQARSILAGAYQPNVFPIGYPVFIALLTPVTGDGVRAAQVVSVLAGIGSLFVFFLLCKRLMSRTHAVVACLIFAATPLFIHMTTTTMSESLATFWVLLGLLLFAVERDFYAGLCLGAASITRPETLAIAGILTLLRLRRPRRMFRFAAGCALVYFIGVTIESLGRGQIMLLRKSSLFGSGAVDNILREEWIEFDGKEKVIEELVRENAETSIVLYYLRRLPGEILLLLRHVMPALFALALYGIWKKRHFALALFAPFAIFPLFTLRSEARFLYPYLPGIILFAFIGLESLRADRWRKYLYIVIGIFLVAGWWINREQVLKPVSSGYRWTKEGGVHMSPRITPGATFADRKPYLAFYAGGEYVEIPTAPYEDVMNYLYTQDIEFLVLHEKTIERFRPHLLPLLFDRPVINGELRYTQAFSFSDAIVYGNERTEFSGVLIYRKNRFTELPTRRRLIAGSDIKLSGPAWSPDGNAIACRVRDESGRGEIRLVNPVNGESRLIMQTTQIDDPISWSPDSKRLAFVEYVKGNYDIYVYNQGGEIDRITVDKAADRSPSWSSDGNQMAFCSNRSGQDEVYVRHFGGGGLERIADSGGCSFPSISPGGRYIAFVRVGEGLYIHDRETSKTKKASAPLKVQFPPVWSPDGRTIAVSAMDMGNMQIYLVTADGRDTACLTNIDHAESQPAWSPDGMAVANVTMIDGKIELWVIEGVEAYAQRILDSKPAVVLER